MRAVDRLRETGRRLVARGRVAARRPDDKRDARHRVARGTVEARARARRGGHPGNRPRAAAPSPSARAARAPARTPPRVLGVLRPCRLGASPDVGAAAAARAAWRGSRLASRRSSGLAGDAASVPAARSAAAARDAGRGAARRRRARPRHEDARLLRPGRALGRRRDVQHEGYAAVGGGGFAPRRRWPGRPRRVRRARPPEPKHVENVFAAVAPAMPSYYDGTRRRARRPRRRTAAVDPSRSTATSSRLAALIVLRRRAAASMQTTKANDAVTLRDAWSRARPSRLDATDGSPPANDDSF